MKFVNFLILLIPVRAQQLYNPKPSTVIPWKSHNATSVGGSAIFNQQYYLSDRTNAAVEVFDISSASQITTIKGFRGLVPHPHNKSDPLETEKANLELSGPNGLVVLSDRDELYVADGDGTVRVINLANNSIVANISTGATRRANAVAYCPWTKLVFVTYPNIQENNPQGVFVDPLARSVAGQVTFNRPNTGTLTHGYHVASTLSEAVYKPNDRFYVASSSTVVNPGGEIIEIDPFTLTISHTFGLDNCYPVGLMFNNEGHLFVGCSNGRGLASPSAGGPTGYSLVLRTSSNKWSVIGNVSGVSGVDQVAYSQSLGSWFAAAYRERTAKTRTAGSSSPNSSSDETTHKQEKSAPQVDIINSTTNKVQHRIQTDNRTGQTVAVDPHTHNLIVPLIGGIAIYKLERNATHYLDESIAASTQVDSYVGIVTLMLVVLTFYICM